MLVNFPVIYYAEKKAEIGRIQLTLYNRIRVLYQYVRYDDTAQYILISLGSSNRPNAHKILEEW